MLARNTNLCSQRGCREAWRRVLDTRPEHPPTDPECFLWYERVQCSRLDLLLPLVKASLVLLDAGLDLKVAVQHYKHGDHYWALYTLIIVVITEFFLQAVSACWFIEDKKDRKSQKQSAMKETGIEVKPWLIICHFMVFGRFVRFYHMWKVLRVIRTEGDAPLEDERAQRKFIGRHMLYISLAVDCNTLQLMEAFLEQAPQVALQLHILMQQNHVDLTSHKDLLVTLCIVKSLLLFAYSHVTFARDMRRQEKCTAPLRWLSTGAVALFFWRLFMLVSRILALALFSSTFRKYTCVLIALHFLVFLVIVAKQDCDYFETSPKKQALFKLAVTYIHIFSFFILVSEKTQKWGFIYYYITFVENSVVLMLWVYYCSWGSSIKIAAIVVVKLSFAVGLACLALYYRRFHPSIVQRREDKPRIKRPILEYMDGTTLQFETAV